MISIIVPVFNVEPYLEQCLDSIIHQTYRDIEIIVVNDGSTDRSGEICRAYAGRDRRIVLFETENRGLSAARNLGIDNAHGEWIMFVDSDDWVEPEFCEAPLRAAMENDADLVIFDRTIFNVKGQIIGKKIKLKGIISARTAVDYGRPAVWNKLYKKNVFNSTRYPEGRLCEDVATTHKLICSAKRIVALDRPFYNYRMRKESISNSGEERFYREGFLAHLQRYDDLIQYGYPREELERERMRQALQFLMKMEPVKEPLFQQAEEIVSTWQGDVDSLKAKERDAVKIWRMNKKLFHSYCRIKGWKV